MFCSLKLFVFFRDASEHGEASFALIFYVCIDPSLLESIEQQMYPANYPSRVFKQKFLGFSFQSFQLFWQMVNVINLL